MAKPSVKIRKSTTFVLGQGPHDLHTPKGPSLTVPDMAMPLSEILSRHTRGLEIPQFSPEYSEEEFPNFKSMDLVELQEYKEYIKDRTKELQARLKKVQSTERQLVEQQAPTPVPVLAPDPTAPPVQPSTT